MRDDGWEERREEFRRIAAREGFRRIAEEIGTSHMTVYRLAAGANQPRPATREAIERVIEAHQQQEHDQ